jgi:hypothetical protein
VARNAGNKWRKKLLLPKKPFLGMNGVGKNATGHGGTVYGFGKEAKKAAAEGPKARRLREAVSHAGGLEASPKRHDAAVASLALANSTPRYGLGIDDVCLWGLPGRAIRVCSGGSDSIAAQATPSGKDGPGVREGVGATAGVVFAAGCRGGSSSIARGIDVSLDYEWFCRAGL